MSYPGIQNMCLLPNQENSSFRPTKLVILREQVHAFQLLNAMQFGTITTLQTSMAAPRLGSHAIKDATNGNLAIPAMIVRISMISEFGPIVFLILWIHVMLSMGVPFVETQSRNQEAYRSLVMEG
jgi:hypothetical protein